MSPSCSLAPIRRATAFVALGLALALTPARSALGAPAEAETFHLNEITHLMVGWNGDTSVQAIELKLLSAGENLVGGVSIVIYNASGAAVATLGTFGGSLANGLAGDHILCATANFQATFGITPDLIITAGIPVTTGQVSFEKPTCRVNTVPYGAIVTPVGGVSAAPPLPSGGATILNRTVDSPVSACPASVPEDAANRFVLATGSPTAPIVFHNNARASVNVSSTVTGVGAPAPPVAVLRASPNPFQTTTLVEAPGWRPLTIHDVRGRLVRVLTCRGSCPQVAGPYRGVWDGTDGEGRRLPSGIYFLKYAGESGPVIRRIALLR